MLYSCTHMATVGVRGLIEIIVGHAGRHSLLCPRSLRAMSMMLTTVLTIIGNVDLVVAFELRLRL